MVVVVVVVAQQLLRTGGITAVNAILQSTGTVRIWSHRIIPAVLGDMLCMPCYSVCHKENFPR
jgi:hypothetical protein